MGHQNKKIEVTEVEGGRVRQLRGLLGWLLLIATALGTLWVLNFVFCFDVHLFNESLWMPTTVFAISLSLFGPFTFLIFPMTTKSSRDRVPWYDYIFAVLIFLTPLWAALHAYEAIFEGLAIVTPPIAQWNGALLCLLLFEGTRRTAGLSFSCLFLFFALFPLFCQYMPGPIMGKGYSFARTMGFHYLGVDSIFGLPMRIFTRLIFGFLVFATALRVCGGGQFFIDLAMGLLGRVRGGPAKVSVFASGLFGTISGSAVANVATIGSITIPIMKKVGYPSYYAGAIEACASLGGILMPPVMGITAFIMAEFLGIPYTEVCIAAIVPAILYYTCLLFQVDFYAARAGLKGIPKEQLLPSMWKTLKGGWPYIFAVVILIGVLFYFQLEEFSPWFATVAIFIFTMATKNRLTRETLRSFFAGLGKVFAELIPILAAVGVVIGSLSLTGVGVGLSGEIVRFAGDNLILLLITGAVAAMILGIGLTITACYVILAVVLAPGLIKAGLDPLSVHLFIFYCGMLSDISPPVAIAAYTAAFIAEANPFRTSLKAMRLAAVLYILPFFFVLNPALILRGEALQVFWVVGQAIIGVILMASGLEGYLFHLGRLSGISRLLFFAAGILIVFPNFISTIIGVGIGAVSFFLQKILGNKKPWVPA
jgi:TRAP transporter 4TM/12TM fusion protein